jgi:hypothetical protein
MEFNKQYINKSFFCLDISSTSTQVQKKQKIKARDVTLVSPFPQLLSRCFVGDFSTTSKKTRLSSTWKPEHPSAGGSLNVFSLCHPKFPTESE